MHGKQPDLGPEVLDDVVQKAITNLEQGRERVAMLAESARSHAAALSDRVGALREELAAQRTAMAALVNRAEETQRKLHGLLTEQGASREQMLEAFEALVEANRALGAAQAREEALSAHLTDLEQWARSAGEVTGGMESLADQMSELADHLATNFRTLGSRLESALQSRALGLHVIRAQEEERRRLAREIHDGPTQLLNSVVLRIDVCQRFFDSDLERLRDELQQLKELVRMSLQDVRKIIFDLRPMALDDLGLIPALRTYLKDYQAKTGIETDFTVFGNDRRYDPTFEIAVFRIIQEALTNVSKHAGATRVWVKVETTGGKEIKVQVKDDGVGFDPESVTPGAAGASFGLVTMRERTELLGGRMEIHSAPGHGTKLNFVFPLAE